MNRIVKAIRPAAFAFVAAVAVLGATAAQAAKDPVSLTTQFFEALKKRDIGAAFALTDDAFRKATPRKAFGPYVLNNKLHKTVDYLIDERRKATASGADQAEKVYVLLQREGMKTITVLLSMARSGNEWKVRGIRSDDRDSEPAKTAAKSAPASKPTTTPKAPPQVQKSVPGLKTATKRFPTDGSVPSEQDFIRMANATIVDFAKSVNAKDMTFFRSTVSQKMQKESSVQVFNNAFKQFFNLSGDLMATQKTPFVFTGKPGRANLGGVLVRGKWETRPSRVTFAARYINENGEWKLAAIDVKAQPVKKDS